MLGFLGPNGAGKSTTMRMIAGYLAPTAGTARVAGLDVHREPVRCKERLGYLPEGAPLYPEMTPAAILSFIADIRGLKGRAKAGRLEETERKLYELQDERPDASSSQLTSEQQTAIEEYRQEKVRIRRDLRDVQFQLRRDIERLERRIVAVNTGLVPLLVILAAVAILTHRKRRKRVWEKAGEMYGT